MLTPGGPLVSVILAVRNEENAIERTLASVESQDYAHGSIEVLVADGRSTDRTREIVGEYSRRQAAVQLLDNPDRIMAAGFNRALGRSTGDVIVMLGGHSELAPDYIRRADEALERTGADCVGGVLETVGTSRRAVAIAAAMGSRFGVGGASFRVGSAVERWVDTVAFGAYRRDVFERIGRLDEGLVRNQDDEFNYRLRKAGGKILLSPGLRVRYFSRAGLAGMARQYFEYGMWKVLVLKKHPAQMQARHFVPPAFVGAIGVTALGSAVSPWLALACAVIGGSYVAANLSASVNTARRAGWQLAPHLPAVYAVLHIAYGSGFLAGFVRFGARSMHRRGGASG